MALMLRSVLVSMTMSPEGCSVCVFSAGAVAPPLLDAAEFFEKKFKIKCDVRVDKPSILLDEIERTKSGDVFSSGAEYILDDAEERGLIIQGSRKSLGY